MKDRDWRPIAIDDFAVVRNTLQAAEEEKFINWEYAYLNDVPQLLAEIERLREAAK